MSQSEAKRPRLGLQELSADGEKNEKDVMFLAIHPTLVRSKTRPGREFGAPNELAVAWSLYRGTEIEQQGIADSEGSDALAESLRQVYSKDGFAVAFKLDKEILAWFRDTLSEEDYQAWRSMKKSQLYNFDLYRKVDADCYEYWSLSQLHAEVRPGEDARRESTDCKVLVQLVGEAFHWFVTHCEDKELKLNFTGPLENRLIRVNSLHVRKGCGKVKERAAWLRTGNQWDTLTSPGRDLPAGIKYVVVDVETHGWGTGIISRIVEIAWMSFDSDGNGLESKQYLLKPYGYVAMSPQARDYHGITTRCVNTLGSDANLVFAEFTNILRQIPGDGFVIAHNMKHEDSIFRTNLNEEQKIIWKSAPKCDTCAKTLLRYLPNADPRLQLRKYGLNLSDLYETIFPSRSIYGAHSALVDVRMTWEIFQYYEQETTHKEGTGAKNVLEWKLVVDMAVAAGGFLRAVRRRLFG